MTLEDEPEQPGDFDLGFDASFANYGDRPQDNVRFDVQDSGLLKKDAAITDARVLLDGYLAKHKGKEQGVLCTAGNLLLQVAYDAKVTPPENELMRTLATLVHELPEKSSAKKLLDFLDYAQGWADHYRLPGSLFLRIAEHASHSPDGWHTYSDVVVDDIAPKLSYVTRKYLAPHRGLFESTFESETIEAKVLGLAGVSLVLTKGVADESQRPKDRVFLDWALFTDAGPLTIIQLKKMYVSSFYAQSLDQARREAHDKKSFSRRNTSAGKLALVTRSLLDYLAKHYRHKQHLKPIIERATNSLGQHYGV